MSQPTDPRWTQAESDLTIAVVQMILTAARVVRRRSLVRDDVRAALERLSDDPDLIWLMRYAIRLRGVRDGGDAARP